jgi:hypothetical protein
VHRRAWWRAPEETENSSWREFLYGLMIGGTVVFLVGVVLVWGMH